MSQLAKRKTRLVVEFAETVRECGKYREVLMELTPFGVKVRLKGLRASFEISPAAIYNRAALLEAERVRAEKRNGRTRR